MVSKWKVLIFRLWLPKGGWAWSLFVHVPLPLRQVLPRATRATPGRRQGCTARGCHVDSATGASTTWQPTRQGFKIETFSTAAVRLKAWSDASEKNGGGSSGWPKKGQNWPLELCRCKVDPKRGLHNKTEESLFHSFVTRSPVRLSRIQSNHLGVSPRVVHLQNCHFDRNTL